MRPLLFSVECSGSRFDSPASIYAAAVLYAIRCIETSNFSANLGEVISGVEGAALISKCRTLHLQARKWVLWANTGLVVKDSAGISLAGEISGEPSGPDVILGDSDEHCYDIYLSLRHEEGRAIRVRVVNSETPFLEPGTGPYKITYAHPVRHFLRSLYRGIFG